MTNKSKKILSELSVGELLDKISILEIKLTKIKNPDSQKEIKKEYKPDFVVNIGDLLDFHAINMHTHDPDLYSAGHELKLAKKFVKAGCTNVSYSLESGNELILEAMNKRVSTFACDAGRWAGEMDQISDTFGSTGMTPYLHKGAADVFRLLDASPIGIETRETYDKNRTMQKSIEIYAETARILKSKKDRPK